MQAVDNRCVRDDDVRSSCFAALDVLQAKWGADIPYRALSEGFNFRGRRVPFLNRAYGIFRSAEAQRGPAALSVNSSFRQDRYQDEETSDGVLYAYQGTDPENHSTSGYGARTYSTCRSSISSARARIGIDRSTRPSSRTIGRPSYESCSASGGCADRTTSANRSTSRTRSNAGMSCGKSSSGSTRRSSAEWCCRRIRIDAQSAD